MKSGNLLAGLTALLMLGAGTSAFGASACTSWIHLDAGYKDTDLYNDRGRAECVRDVQYQAQQAAKAKKERDVMRAADPEPLPVEQREVTAILLKTDFRVAANLGNAINEGKEAQAAYPVAVITGLFEFFVDPIRWLLLALTGMICVVSGISILVSIYNSMSERRHEIAVMRALGAGRGTVMSIILLESTLLSLAGGIVGWLAGHLLAAAASPIVEEQTGVSIGFNLWGEPFLQPLVSLGIDQPWAEAIAMPMELLLVPGLIVRRPSSVSIRSARHLRRVVLPAPFRPISASRSRSPMNRSSPRNSQPLPWTRPRFS